MSSLGRYKKMRAQKHYPPESRKDINYYRDSTWKDYYGSTGYNADPLGGIDLDEEHIKILEKKSTLSPRHRKLVLKRFGRNNAMDFIFSRED